MSVDANISFQALNNEIILSAVESTGLRCTGRLFPLNSMENRVYSVEVEPAEGQTRARQVIAKFYRPERWQLNELLSEHLMARALSFEEIPTPRYFEIKDAAFATQPPAEFLSAEHGLHLPRADTLGKCSIFYFCVWEKISGRPPLDLLADELVRIGRLIARMHNLFENKMSNSFYHRPRFTTTSFGREALENLRNCKLIPRPLDGVILSHIETLLHGLSWYDTSIDFVPVHGDLHRLNLLQTEANGEFWVVDFDDCVWAPEVHDLWLLASGCHMNEDDPTKAFELAFENLCNGYSEFRVLPEGSSQLIEPLRTLRMIHYAGWLAKRWQDPLFKEVFSFFAEFSYWERFLADIENQKMVLEQRFLLDL